MADSLGGPVNKLDLEDRRDRLLGRCLRRQAEAIPDRDFLVFGETHYSYGRVNELANSMAGGFTSLGVSRGDTVAMMMDSCPDYVWSTLGLNKLGAVWVPTNTDYKGQWLRESLEDSRAKVLVVDEGLLPRVAEAGGELPFEHIVVRGDPKASALGAPALALSELERAPAKEPDDSDLFLGDTAAILWTSGTTGRSKGVMQSHNVWIRAAVDGAANSNLREGEIIYCCLPMYQSAAWVANLYRALVCGVPCAIDERFSVNDFWDRCRYYGATMVFTLGAMHVFLWQQPERPDDADNPVRSAGMVPMPDPMIEPFKKRFGIEEIHQGYGQSEVMGLLARRYGKTYKPNSLGEASDGIEVQLLDDRDFPVAPGEVGEFGIRPTEPYAIFNGYFNDPEATVRAWSNLWYHSGDLGRQDEDGEYFFVDRKKDFIRYKGRNISSFQVEAAFMAHDAVAQCAAHAVTSAELEAEAEMKLCVVLKPGQSATPEELCRFVNETAPYFFIPRYLELMTELPSTPTGRVQKYKLRERGVTPETWDARQTGFVVER
jgi:crotonobetaine/carnitine-CoA ligase